jgi:serine/threonine protein kinase
MLKPEPGLLLHERYQLKSKLGSGGMATVFSATDLQKQIDVAIKFLNPDQVAIDRRRKRFLREFEIIAGLEHPNIIAVYEQSAQAQEELYFSMQLLDALPLDQLIQDSAKNSNQNSSEYIKTAINLLTQIAAALNYLHQAGIVFCDLKPANVLVEKESSLVKLIDFGIAIRINKQQVDPEESKMLGTSLYMSPEQIRSEKLTPCSDIYSFGVLAFELLTGSVPYPQENLFAVTASHLIGKIPEARALNKSVPADLDMMLQICLEKNAEDRYQDFGEILSKLQSLYLSLAEPKRGFRLWDLLFSR